MSMLDKYDAAFAAARDILAKALTGPAPGPAERLFRWIDAGNINPWGVFADPLIARGMETAEGAAGVLQSLNHFLSDGRDISFPITAWHGPKIVLLGRKEPDFEARFQDQITAHGHGETVIESHRIIGFCADTDAFIEAFDRHSAEMKAIFDDLQQPDP